MQTKQNTKQVILWVGDIAFDTYEKLDPKIRSRFDHEIVLFEKQGNSKACKSIVYIKNKEHPNLNYNIDELQFHHALFLEKRETKYHLIVGCTLELLFVSFLESIKKHAKKRFSGMPLINCYKRKLYIYIFRLSKIFKTTNLPRRCWTCLRPCRLHCPCLSRPS